jgi:hypothetical protein
MTMRLLSCLVAAAVLCACDIWPRTLPGGYRIGYGDRNKSWLQNPDGTVAHGTLIHRLYRDDRRILLIAPVATYGSVQAGPLPLDGTCEIALLIDTPERRTTQVRLAEAERLARGLSEVLATGRRCLPA